MEIDLKICWKHSTSRARSADDEQLARCREMTPRYLQQPALHCTPAAAVVAWIDERGLRPDHATQACWLLI
jgi:hypothetical protein